jgi:propanol-preferring alcohol dehydrogenase
MAVASQGKIRHTVKIISLDQVNETLALLRTGDVVARVVIKL